MSTKERILPLDDESFKQDAKNFFKLPIDAIGRLFDALETQQTSLSTAAVSRLLLLSLSDARERRYTLLGLLRILSRQSESARQKAMDDLVSIGCDRLKVDLFVQRTSKASKAARSSADLMVDVLKHYFEGEHLMDTHFVVSYRNLSRNEKPPLLFPTVYASIVSHTEEDITKEVRLYLDANEFEALVLTFQQTLDQLRAESKALKASLAEKYVELIGE